MQTWGFASLLPEVGRKRKGGNRGAIKRPEVMDRKSQRSILRGGDERARNRLKGPAASLLSWASAFSSVEWRLRVFLLSSFPSSLLIEEGETVRIFVRQLTHCSCKKFKVRVGIEGPNGPQKGADKDNLCALKG